MSSYGFKRKARIIKTLEDGGIDAIEETEHPEADADSSPVDAALSISQAVPAAIRFGRSKPTRSSSLRKSINADNHNNGDNTLDPAAQRDAQPRGDDEANETVVIRPALVKRAGSTKLKKRIFSSSRLSFGGGATEAGSSEAAANSDEHDCKRASTPKKMTLGQRVLENNAFRRPGSQEEQSLYSREYLEELQSSTPNTPQNIASLHVKDDGVVDVDAEPGLDSSELDGAVIVQSREIMGQISPVPPTATIFTEAQIRQRKERRERLRTESEFLSLDASDVEDDEDREDGCPRSIALQLKSKKPESRLVAEDEDLGEGFDDYVQASQTLALGRKAEREQATRNRREMEEMIRAAEAGSDDDSDDSEAERRAAYEAAQRRKGMDGLKARRRGLGGKFDNSDKDDDDDDGGGGLGCRGIREIPKLRPLPDFGEVIRRMQDLVHGLDEDVSRKRARITTLEREKEGILAREKEVQEILNKAGAKYQAVAGSSSKEATQNAATNKAATSISIPPSPSRGPMPLIIPGNFPPVERGLESFGTPAMREDTETKERD